MKAAVCPVYRVRNAVVASCLEIEDYRLTGHPRHCRTVGRLLLGLGVSTSTLATFTPKPCARPNPRNGAC